MKIIEIRAIEGANIYCHRPVLKLTIDLEKYFEILTSELPGFKEQLLYHIPSLSEHHCSRGKVGGFAERLTEGTYLGHVIEHVALELQYLCGMDVIYGKTIAAENLGIYHIITEYESKQGGVQALISAVEIIQSLLENAGADIEKELHKISLAVFKNDLGPSTGAIAKEALKKGIPVMRLGDGSILQLGYGKYQQRVAATITGQTRCVGVDISCDKALAKQLLGDSGIPVPWGGVAETLEEAIAITATIRDAVAIKPLDGNQGKGVSLQLKTKQEIEGAFAAALAVSPRVIVEKHIKGKHYRLVVVGDEVVAAAERIPAFVVGDGVNTIKGLVDGVNADPLRGEGHERPLTKIKIDSVVLMVLAKKGFSPESVPEAGKIVYLRENANISTGGIAVDVTDKVHPEIKFLAVQAAKVVGLDVAGIDIVARSIEQPLTSDNGAVIEVNAAPGIRMHHYPAVGKPRNVAGAIVDLLIPPGSQCRIPIVSVTGTNGKTTVTRLISHILQGIGLKVGMTTTDGIYINGRQIVRGDSAGPRSAQVVLRDSMVEAAVLETARGGILRSGLGYDFSDVSIITNITNDHLGIDGVETLEDMAYVKAVVAEAVHREGKNVLNADDKHVMPMVGRIKSGIIYFSTASDNIIVRRHLGVGGTAVFVKNGSVVVADGAKIMRVLPIKHIPSTLGGTARHNLQNIVAAVGGSIALGISLEDIRRGLLSFTCDENCNPGRFNIFNLGKLRVIMDYGHNEAGITTTLQTLKKLKPKKIIGVVGMPGDRKDEDICLVGKIVAKYCAQIIIKEDSDLRGREAGEVPEIIKRAVAESGKKQSCIEIIHSEIEAINRGIALAQEGDAVVVFYEKLDPVLTHLKEISKQLSVKNEPDGSAQIIC